MQFLIDHRINKGNVSKNVDVTFDEDSRWVLTGNSYVNTLTVTKKDLILMTVIGRGKNVEGNPAEAASDAKGGKK